MTNVKILGSTWEKMTKLEQKMLQALGVLAEK